MRAKIYCTIMFVLFLTGCSSTEVKQSEAVEQVFNTEVIEHTADVTLPTTEEETDNSGVGSIVLNQFESSSASEPEVESTTSAEVKPEVNDTDEITVPDETIEVSANIEDTGVDKSKQVELNGRLAVKYENGVLTYELVEDDTLLKEDSFSDVSFLFVSENRTAKYPGTIEAVKEYTNDLKEMIILFYRQATSSTALQLIYKEVGIKEFTPDLYNEKMDIYEEGKQRMRVEINWDKLNNKPITISMHMIEGTEGEVIENSQER